MLFKLNGKYDDAYKIEYEEPNWSDDKETNEKILEECQKNIEIKNSYIALVIENNNKILELLKNNYHYIDADDIKVFQEFITDYTRYKKEIEEAGQLKTPFRVYRRIGPISFIKPELISRVAEKFNTINQEIKKYQAK